LVVIELRHHNQISGISSSNFVEKIGGVFSSCCGNLLKTRRLPQQLDSPVFVSRVVAATSQLFFVGYDATPRGKRDKSSFTTCRFLELLRCNSGDMTKNGKTPGFGRDHVARSSLELKQLRQRAPAG